MTNGCNSKDAANTGAALIVVTLACLVAAAAFWLAGCLTETGLADGAEPFTDPAHVYPGAGPASHFVTDYTGEDH